MLVFLRRMALVGVVLAAPVGHTQAPAERALNKEVVVQATLEQVWDAWTTREGITSFFAPDAHIDARPGGAFEIYFDPTAASGSKGADGMQYLALQPKQMLSFTWNAPPHLPQARAQRTSVVVRLYALDDNKSVRVTLQHSGWGTGGEWDAAYAYFDKAWPTILGNLQKRFVAGPQDWTAWLNQLKQMKKAKP